MKKLCFIGGDMRQIRVINKMAKRDYAVSVYGFEKANKTDFTEAVEFKESVAEAAREADVVILPLPYTLSREMINAPQSDEEIHQGDVLRSMKEGALLLAGKADASLAAIAALYKIRIIDYFKREELEILNAVPTAEGAIEIAMREMPITINQSRCLILGNGKIGKTLGKMLMGLGAKVTVCVRKPSAAAYARSNGEDVIFFRSLAEEIGKFDIIFNTVPAAVVTYRVLQNVRGESLIIDLASLPGGVDFETAAQLEKRTIHALSLPGKVAPQTAGDIIFETIINILEELGV